MIYLLVNLYNGMTLRCTEEDWDAMYQYSLGNTSVEYHKDDKTGDESIHAEEQLYIKVVS